MFDYRKINLKRVLVILLLLLFVGGNRTVEATTADVEEEFDATTGARVVLDATQAATLNAEIAGKAAVGGAICPPGASNHIFLPKWRGNQYPG